MKTSLFKLISNALAVLLILLFFSVSLGVQAEPLMLTGQGYYNLSPQVQFFKDEHGELEHWRLWEAEQQHSIKWQSTRRDEVNFGLTTDTYWFKVDIVNANASNIEWVLEIAAPLLDNVDVYLFNAEGRVTQYYYSGDILTSSQKSVSHPNLVFPLTLPTQEVFTLYVQVASTGAIQLPFNLWTWEQFNQRTMNYFTLQGIFIGLVVIMLLFNLAMYIAKREIIYLFYSGYIFFLSIFNLGRLGISYHFFLPHSIYLHDAIIFLTGFFAIGCLCFFIALFFEFEKHDPRWNKLTRSLGVGYFVVGLVSITLPYNISVFILAVFATLIALFLMLVSTRMLVKNRPYARYFAVAWYTFLISTILLVLNKFGYVERSVITEYGVQFGIAIEILCFSLALADRMTVISQEMVLAKNQSVSMAIRVSQEREKSFDLQKQFLQQSIEQNHVLEKRVQQRTDELNKALDELSEANSRLKQASITDGLTGLHNRYYFDEQWQSEYKRAHREQVSLSLLLLDIDHFKSINDQFGHPAGDQCLQSVTKVLEQFAARDVDVIARYGGEEFAIILPATDDVGAQKVAEGIRRGVEQLKVMWEGKSILMTISVGVASQIPIDSDYLSRDAMLKRADQALYEAKRAGRNRMVVYQPV